MDRSLRCADEVREGLAMAACRECRVDQRRGVGAAANVGVADGRHLAIRAGERDLPGSERPIRVRDLRRRLLAGEPAQFRAADADAGQDPAVVLLAPCVQDADAGPADTSPTYENGVDAVPVLPLAAAVTDGEPTARPRRRRSLALRFGVSFVLGVLLVVGAGVGVLYAWGQQYDGRVLPGVRVGSTELGGLTREQAAAEIANAYGSLATGQITLTGPDGRKTTISYADVGRGPDTSA
ncbi:MAG TPA: hypothetical protein VK697_09600, partial [Methylomirabilota bacterium]|nr:hypothetical protein [Methylomirabilota bacterium]